MDEKMGINGVNQTVDKMDENAVGKEVQKVLPKTTDKVAKIIG